MGHGAQGEGGAIMEGAAVAGFMAAILGGAVVHHIGVALNRFK